MSLICIMWQCAHSQIIVLLHWRTLEFYYNYSTLKVNTYSKQPHNSTPLQHSFRSKYAIHALSYTGYLHKYALLSLTYTDFQRVSIAFFTNSRTFPSLAWRRALSLPTKAAPRMSQQTDSRMDSESANIAGGAAPYEGHPQS